MLGMVMALCLISSFRKLKLLTCCASAEYLIYLTFNWIYIVNLSVCLLVALMKRIFKWVIETALVKRITTFSNSEA